MRSDITVLLAGDLPFLTHEFVDLLVGAVRPESGAVAHDAEGQPQWLCSAWPSALLRSIDWASTPSLRAGLGLLSFEQLRVDAGAVAPWLDCDTPEDLQRARRMV